MEEHKHKLLATESCEGEGTCSESVVDRFSILSEGLAYHIISFLSIRDLTRFSSVSKRCRQLYLSTPLLNFDGFLLPTRAPTGEFQAFRNTTCDVRLKLLNSLDRFLLARGDNKMQYFRLMWDGHSMEDSDGTPCFCVNERFPLITWIHNAVRCNVEVLHVDTGVHDFDEERLAFPSCVFSSATLSSLGISLDHTIVKTPSFSVSSNLTYLELRNVVIEDEGFFKWISCSYKFIKELFLCDVWYIENITIESSFLEEFKFLEGELRTQHLNISGPKLEKIDINWRFAPRGYESLNICAPNLKYFSWSGNVMNHVNLGKLEGLEEVAILMEPKVHDSNNLFEVCCSLNRVEALVVNKATIKALFREGSMPARLDNLVYLYMSLSSFSDVLVPAVVSLLRGIPSLCTLYTGYWSSLLDCKSDASGFDKEYWKLQNLAFIHELEEVTITLSDESNPIVFARYILEHADSLEKMVIIYLPEHATVYIQDKHTRVQRRFF